MSAPPAPLFNGISQIAIASSDPVKLSEWYRGVLGLELLFATAGMIFLNAGHVRLMIGPKQPDQTIGTEVVLYLEPSVWNAAEDAIEAAGIAFLHPAVVLQRAEGRELALRGFRDPEGHRLALFGWRHVAAGP